MKKRAYLRRIGISLALTLLFIAPYLAAAPSSADSRTSINDATLRLVQFCNDSKTGFDERDITTLVDYVLSTKNDKTFVLPESKGCPGAYHEFDTNIVFPRFLEYSFNALIPSVVTRPSSLRYSLWRDQQGKAQRGCHDALHHRTGSSEAVQYIKRDQRGRNAARRKIQYHRPVHMA